MEVAGEFVFLNLTQKSFETKQRFFSSFCTSSASMLKRVLLLLFVITIALVVVEATPTVEIEQELRKNYVTPHTKFAIPASWIPTTTKPRVLFLCNNRWSWVYTYYREIIELMQRFDIEADAAYYVENKWHGGSIGLNRLSNLILNTTVHHDVYLFYDLSPSLLPIDLYKAVLEQTWAGKSSIVLAGSQDTNLTSTHFTGTTTPNDPSSSVSLHSFGSGRVASLPILSGFTFTLGWEIPYDHFQENLGRTLLWSSNKLPEVCISLSRINDTVVITLNSNPVSNRITKLLISGKRNDGMISRQSNISIPVSSNDLIFDVNLVGTNLAGSYYVDVIALNANENVVSWKTMSFTITNLKNKMTLVMNANHTFGEIGDIRFGTVVFKNPIDSLNDKIMVEFRDRRWRMISTMLINANQQLINQTNFTFSFTVQDWFPMLIQIRAVLISSNSGDELLDSIVYFTATKRRRGEFVFVSWDVPGGPTAGYAQQKLYDIGVQVQLHHGNPPRLEPAYDIPAVIYTTWVDGSLDANGNLKPMPWNQLPEIQNYIDEVVNALLPSRQSGVYGYSLGDEITTRGCDLSTSDLLAYQVFLQKLYNNSISALNYYWNSAYTSFTQIQLLNSTERLENIAFKNGNFPRWFDRRLWQNENTIQYYEKWRQSFQKLDPKAFTGFEGAGMVDEGDDIQGFVDRLDWWSPYPGGNANEILRSIAPSNFPHSNWFGYKKTATGLQNDYWTMVMEGSHGIFYWMWCNIGSFMGLLRPDYEVFDEISEMLEDTKITREGLGDLLMQSAPDSDGVALLYSRISSIHGTAFRTHYSYMIEKWQWMLRQIGIGFSFITDKNLDFDTIPSTVKVLIAPKFAAVTFKQAKTLKKFVENGGILISDFYLARYQDHLKPVQGNGVLDELFGINTTGSATTGKTGGHTLVYINDKQIGLSWHSECDLNVKPTTAIALGNDTTNGAYLVLVNKVGSGKTVFLNLNLWEEQYIVPIIRELLLKEQSGFDQKIKVSGWSFSNNGNLHMNRWKNGQVDFLGLLAASKQGVVNITLVEPKRVLNLRTKEDLGITNKFSQNLSFGSAVFYAMFPSSHSGAIPKINARFTTTKINTVKVGNVAKLELKVENAFCDHGALITCVKSDGTEADWIKKAIVIPRNGNIIIPIPIALNDPEGDWIITIKDVFGTTAETTTTTTIHLFVTKSDVIEPIDSSIIDDSNGNNINSAESIGIGYFLMMTISIISFLHLM